MFLVVLLLAGDGAWLSGEVVEDSRRRGEEGGEEPATAVNCCSGRILGLKGATFRFLLEEAVTPLSSASHGRALETEVSVIQYPLTQPLPARVQVLL